MLEWRTLLGRSAAILATSPARTQQKVKFAIGYLGFALDTREHWLTAFRKGLAAEGYVEGRDVTIEYRSDDQGGRRLQDFADDLVRQNVAVIVTTGTPAVLAAKRATQNIPIVFAIAADPERMGLVASFNRPGANITGIYFQITELVAKRLAQLHEVLPTAKRMED